MKKILLLSLFLIIETVNSQQILISTIHYNVLYLGSVNYVGVMVEGFECKDIKIEIDNGTVQGKNCEYVVLPQKIGDLKISIYNKKNKLLGQKILKVLDLCPKVYINAPLNEKGKKNIQKSFSLSIEMKDLNLNFNSSQIEYKVIVLRDNEVIFSKFYSKRVFSDDLKQTMNELKTNDILIFSDIKSTYNEKQFLLNDLILKI